MSAAETVELKKEITGRFTGKQLACFFMAYYILNESTETADIFKQMAAVPIEDVKKAWQSTNALPYNPSKKSATMHTHIMGALHRSATPTDVAELATTLCRSSMKNLFKNCDAVFTSLKELHGLISEAQKGDAAMADVMGSVDAHDIIATIPAPKQAVVAFDETPMEAELPPMPTPQRTPVEPEPRLPPQDEHMHVEHVQHVEATPVVATTTLPEIATPPIDQAPAPATSHASIFAALMQDEPAPIDSPKPPARAPASTQVELDPLENFMRVYQKRHKTGV